MKLRSRTNRAETFLIVPPLEDRPTVERNVDVVTAAFILGVRSERHAHDRASTLFGIAKDNDSWKIKLKSPAECESSVLPKVSRIAGF